MKIKKAIEYFDGYGSPYDDLVIQALEKQMPKKVPKTGMEFKALDVDTKEVLMYECAPCPSCGKWISKIYKYCEHCGQRVEEDR